MVNFLMILEFLDIDYYFDLIGSELITLTVIIVTDGSILGGKGIWIWYFVRSTPTRIPSSISAGAT